MASSAAELPNDVLRAALAAASEAALRAGALMQQCFQERFDRDHNSYSSDATAGVDVALDITEKASETDLVTKYDKECDQLITDALRAFNEREGAAYSFRFITEELSPDEPLTEKPTWIVDPIDGTMSFVHKSFDCCVSIGLAVNRRPVLGVVYCPFLGGTGKGELYTAMLGQGAFLNGRPIHVSTCRQKSKAIVLFNMPWRMAQPAIAASVEMRREMAADRVRAIRSYGAAVLQLAQVACGRADLYMEPGGRIWDVCAGAVLVSEAGGVVRNLDGSPFELAAHVITCGSTTEIVEYGAGLCRKYDLEREYWRD